VAYGVLATFSFAQVDGDEIGDDAAFGAHLAVSEGGRSGAVAKIAYATRGGGHELEGESEVFLSSSPCALGRGEGVVEGAGIVSCDLPLSEAFLGGLRDIGASVGGVVGGADVGVEGAEVVGADVGNKEGVFATCWLRGGRLRAVVV
jgi:hypothetical protein